jgi:hypothetical protein
MIWQSEAPVVTHGTSCLMEAVFIRAIQHRDCTRARYTDEAATVPTLRLLYPEVCTRCCV